jgi:hypothetical protein
MNKCCAVVGRLAESRAAAVQDIYTNMNREYINVLIDFGRRVSSVGTGNRHFYIAGGRQLITLLLLLLLQSFDWLAAFHLDLLKAILFIAV